MVGKKLVLICTNPIETLGSKDSGRRVSIYSSRSGNGNRLARQGLRISCKIPASRQNAGVHSKVESSDMKIGSVLS